MITKLFVVAIAVLAFGATANAQIDDPVGAWDVMAGGVDVGNIGISLATPPNTDNPWNANLFGSSGHSGFWERLSDDTWLWRETEPNPTLNGTIFWYQGIYYFYIEDNNSYGYLLRQ